MTMRILLLGATGRTGRHVLEYALSQGIEVAALVRRAAAITVHSDKLTVVEGSPMNADDVRKAIAGCDAVVSALNNNRTSDNPWARRLSPSLFMTQSIRTCLAAMKEMDMRRIVVLSSVGVNDSFDDAVFVMRWLIRNTNLQYTFQDHDAQESELRRSGMDWTAVRAALLNNGKRLKTLVESYYNEPKPALTISRLHTARFLIDCLNDPATFRKAPTISER
ncbi:NAD(P)H-binding protein [Sideroxydans sp. CL21]|uniref:NAD(P)-dependent oxidoreductase n=1 Tax=Sideroxydans sp. CL21 TaxID=2600596 RepID=UPI0012AAA88C|nr:NAD(P)H-binding protein [Sideroxydans sp. CL21]VVC84653.1 Putative oxidoreductase [Sideroxydans sp. CL21]